MKNPSPKWFRRDWLAALLYRCGPRTVMSRCKRRLLRVLNHFIDVEALRPRRAKKRSYLPELLALESRRLPSLSITGVNNYLATAGTPVSGLNDDLGTLNDCPTSRNTCLHGRVIL